MIFVMYECEERIGYSFKDKTLLRTCFTHSSYSHEHGGKNNERLEFFGDSILGFVVSEYLFGKFPDDDEGKLTVYKQQIVSRKPLAEAVVRLGLNDYILFGEGERKNSPEHHEAACENLFEALVAGIYLDGGLAEATNFIKRALISRFRPDRKAADSSPLTAKTARAERTENYKGKLQEYVQKNKLGDILYRENGKSGPAHEPVFSVSVLVAGKEFGSASGKKKSEAEQGAAKEAFEKLTGADKSVKKSKSDRAAHKPSAKNQPKNKANARRNASSEGKSVRAGNAERTKKNGKASGRQKQARSDKKFDNKDIKKDGAADNAET